jgi:hypothetical protein
MTLSKKGLCVTLSITMFCHFDECRFYFIIMLNVIMLSVVMLNVVEPLAMHEKLFAKHFENSIHKRDFPVGNCLYHQYQVLSCVLTECTLKKSAS